MVSELKGSRLGEDSEDIEQLELDLGLSGAARMMISLGDGAQLRALGAWCP